MTRAQLAAVALALTLGAAAQASDPIGVYALIDKVVLEPNADSPERIQVWGAFQLAQGRGGNEYERPVRGYLYYTYAPGQQGVCRAEWADLKRVAGTGQCVAYGARREPKGGLRMPNEKAQLPDIYPVAQGVFKLDAGHPHARELRALPAPVSPNHGDAVAPGSVTLRARQNYDTDHPQARYIFEMEKAAGAKETSPPIALGGKEATWSPKLLVQASAQYTWRVWATDGRWRGPVASAVFHGKSVP